jgi:hypothetical protein
VLLCMDQGGYLILIRLNKKHMTVGQEASLANNYSTILSKKLSSDAGKIKGNARWHSELEYDSETVFETDNYHD